MALCLLCGSTGAHAHCLSAGEAPRFVCSTCRPAAPPDLDSLAAQLAAVIVAEQANASNARRGPVMPSRMSLRRTKQRVAYGVPSSSSHANNIKTETTEPNSIIASSRGELNLKTPKRQIRSENQDQIKVTDNTFLSPVKLIEQRLKEKKLCGRETENVVLDDSLVERLRQKIGKPRPLSEKRKIVDGILDDLFNNITKDKRKTKEPLKEWNSPKKDSIEADNKNIQDQPPIVITDDVTQMEESKIELDDSSNSTFQLPPEFVAEHNSDDSIPFFETPKKTKTVEIQKDSSMEISENNDVINIDLVKIENTESSPSRDVLPNLKSPERNKKIVLKFSPKHKISKDSKIDIDVEDFKNQYLNEVGRDFKCNFSHNHDSRSSSPKLRTAIDFAIDAAKENRKRKLKSKKSSSKRRKKSHLLLKYECEDDMQRKKLKKKKKTGTKLSITNDNMQVKISLKKEKFKLRIMQSRSENTQKTLKQYVLKHSPGSSKDIIEKPEKDVTPIKRKYIKLEKSPDNLKQMSIHTFFKPKPPKPDTDPKQDIVSIE